MTLATRLARPSITDDEPKRGDSRLRFRLIAFVIVLSNVYAQGQNAVQTRHSKYIDHAVVRHLANSATITANDARPLAQALAALSEEYAWVVDFEDPPYYSAYDLVDDTDAKWRAAHPTAKGVTVIAGDSFQSQFQENPDTGSSVADEERILQKVISDYNESANPGKFSVRNEGDGRFAVVGTQVKDEHGQYQNVNAILDTPVSIQEEARSAFKTIEIILDAVTVKSQTKVSLGTFAQNALYQSQVTIGGQSVPARVLLQRTLSAAKVKLCWHLYYDHDVQMYMLNVLPLMKGGRPG
jgi:hypothetical protein